MRRSSSRDQRSAISDQRSAISDQRSAISDQRSAISYQVAFSQGSLLSGDNTSVYIASPSDAEISQFTLAGKHTRVIRLSNRADYVAGVGRDQDEIEQVRVYRLRKP